MRKFWIGLNYVILFPVLILSLLGVIFAIAGLSGGRTDVSDVLPLFLILGISLFSWERIITIKRKRHLSFQKIAILKPQNWLTLFLVFNVSWFLSCSGVLHTMQSLGEQGNMGTVLLFGKILFIVTGCLYFITLLTDIPFIGVQYFFPTLLRFIKGRVGVFVLYQLAFAAISFLCSLIVISLGQGDLDGQLVTAGFMFAVANDTGAGGYDVSFGSVFSTVAVASTYFGLSEIAQEFLEDPQSIPFGKQLKRMLWDTDTKFLLIMTLLSLASMFVAKIGVPAARIAILLAFTVGFGFSFISFVRQKFLMFLVGVTAMTLIETALPIPEWNGFGTVFMIILSISVRSLLFAVIGLLNGYLNYFASLRKGTVENGMYNVTILQVGAAAAYAFFFPKEVAKTAGEIAWASVTKRKE